MKIFKKYIYILFAISLLACSEDDDLSSPLAPDSPITNFSAEVGIRKVDLSWDRPAGDVKSFIVSYLPDEQSILVNKDSTSITVEGLTADTTYTFSIVWLDSRAQASPEVLIEAVPLPVPQLIFEGNLVLADQQSLDDLDEQYTDVTGDLVIGADEATDINDLSALSTIRVVSGDLIIKNNPGITALVDLTDIAEVSGNVMISDNAILSDFCALQVALTEFDGTLTISGNGYNPNLDQLLSDDCKPDDIIFEGNLVLETQADLDAIQTRYTVITGRLIIGNNANGDITDLSILSSVRKVDFLEVDGNLLLENLEGLSALDSIITGNLTIRDNASIKSLQGLEELTYMRNDIAIFNNPQLESLNGVENMEVVDEIFIGKEGFNGPTGAEKPNPKLTDYCGLQNLVTKNLTALNNNRSVITANAFNPSFDEIAAGNCKTDPVEDNILDGGLRVNTQAEVDALPEYTEITGELVIGLDAATNDITDLSKFSRLTKIGGRMLIQRNPLLEDLSSFINLTSIGAIGGIDVGELVIRENALLTSLEGLDNVTFIGDDLGILDNPELTTLKGLEGLTDVQNRIFVGYQGWQGLGGEVKPNPKLEDYCALQQVITNITVAVLESRECQINNGTFFSPSFQDIVDGDCTQSTVLDGGLRVNTQAEVDALPEYTEITGELVIGLDASTNDISNLSKFSKLEKIGGRFLIQRNPMLTSLSDLSSLTSIGAIGDIDVGELVIRENPLLTSLEGLENLTFIGDDLGILDNAELVTLDGLENLETVQNRIFVGYQGWQGLGGEVKPNPKLTDYCALIQVINNTTVSELENRECAINNGTFFSPSFQDVIDGLCRESGEFVLDEGLRVNTQAEVDALPKYTEITGELVIGLDAASNDITDLSRFERLTEIGGRLIIQRSPLITDLTGFSALEAVGTGSTQELVVRQMDGLVTLDGLQALKSVSRRIGIRENPVLATLEGLNGIESIGENTITIGTSCDATEASLPMLTNFCALSGLINRIGVSTLESGGSCINTNNAFNPSFQDILDGNCQE